MYHEHHNRGGGVSVAVVIPTFRRGPYLVRALQLLREQTRQPDETLVLDQTPHKEHNVSTRRFLEDGARRGEFCWIRLDEPAVSKARNRAIMETGCDVLLYLDDDIEPSEQLVDRHLKHYTNPQVHAVVGANLLPDACEFVSAPPDFSSRSYVEQAFTYRTRFDTPMESVGFMWATNFSVRRESVIAVGGWDEHIVNYGDRDLGLRLATRGYRIDYDPEASIVHLNAPVGGTRVTDPASPWQGWQRCVSLFYLAFRHLRGGMFLRYGVYRAARFSFLLKQNAVRPWRWPAELYGFAKAFFVARRWARDGVKSPFAASNGPAQRKWD